ncbi:alpha/beta fold hydrolase [Amycolatopsis nigrescens]|uniref:alpha/beta fold hydrolase n=1 Tax=Amycolatopsis nigrescens TaxID=381445 RepID=UPI000363F6AC|nr:alpha/beta hydrolase [Amycolatopsis nigrescens]
MGHDLDTTWEAVAPRGRRYEVAGRRLWLHRAGTGGPAVVFLPGASAIGLDHLNVAELAGEFATSVVYDRAGTGWSDPVELPRTCAEVAGELRDLLRVAEVPGPYVLVPHSLGGLYARRFAQLFPDEVAGMVGLEPLCEMWDDHMPEQQHLAHSEIDRAAVPEIPAEQLEFVRELFETKLADWPAEVREPLIDWHLANRSFRVGLVEGGNLRDLVTEIHAAGRVPDLPLITFTGFAFDPGMQQVFGYSDEFLQRLNDAKRTLFDALAASVTDGEHRVLDNASHSWLHIDEPEAVLQGIRDLLDKVGP